MDDDVWYNQSINRRFVERSISAMFGFRECNKSDCDLWIELNREFMAGEIQDDSLWNDTDKVSDEQFKDTFYAGLDNPDRARFLLFEDNGEPIGFANLMIVFSVWTHGLAGIIDDLYLRETIRGKGYGRKAMAVIEEYIKSLGCKRIQFQSELTNPDAEKFYRALGFIPTDMKFYVKYFK